MGINPVAALAGVLLWELVHSKECTLFYIFPKIKNDVSVFFYEDICYFIRGITERTVIQLKYNDIIVNDSYLILQYIATQVWSNVASN
jgi:hypothetical protein